jgi:Response regulator containing CheY-like receiver, AAA-type ATPase, and DNA-binding domains
MQGKVLIVDDSLVARLSLKNILKDTGLALSEANSGEAALTVLGDGAHPDLVFLDLTMPGKGGIETLREIVAAYPSLPVVVVTADIQSSTIAQVEGLGAAAVVRKPADRAEILSVADRLLGKGKA